MDSPRPKSPTSWAKTLPSTRDPLPLAHWAPGWAGGPPPCDRGLPHVAGHTVPPASLALASHPDEQPREWPGRLWERFVCQVGFPSGNSTKIAEGRERKWKLSLAAGALQGGDQLWPGQGQQRL